MVLKNILRTTALGLQTWSVFSGARQASIAVSAALRQSTCSSFSYWTLTRNFKGMYVFDIQAPSQRLITLDGFNMLAYMHSQTLERLLQYRLVSIIKSVFYFLSFLHIIKHFVPL